jgi:hypothetical protein
MASLKKLQAELGAEEQHFWSVLQAGIEMIEKYLEQTSSNPVYALSIGQ